MNTREQLINAAKELQAVLRLEPEIDLQQTDEDLELTLKEATLWLQLPDEITDETIEVLKELNWEQSDLEELEEDQDPIPVFEKYGITIPGVEIEQEEEPEPEPEPVVEEKPKRVRTGAYGIALDIMCSNPVMTLQELYDGMKERGLETRSSMNGAKTARAVFLKIYRKLNENGYIKNGKKGSK